jgi:hypothetical protein
MENTKQEGQSMVQDWWSELVKSEEEYERSGFQYGDT